MSAVDTSIGIVAYLALFSGAGLIFLFANLLVGRFLRPDNPESEKLEIYECGEPTIGSSFVQFDLRFYVVALLFIIFDVEVAFFFPWSAVFGKAAMMSKDDAQVVSTDLSGKTVLSEAARSMYREMGVREPQLPTVVPPSLASTVSDRGSESERSAAIIKQGMSQLSSVLLLDIVVFFAVLMVGFAYVWSRGDLNWVRAVNARQIALQERQRRGTSNRSSALSV
jgi:NADH-quinone oxidoreductase subunit A